LCSRRLYRLGGKLFTSARLSQDVRRSRGDKNCDERLKSVKKLRINQGSYERREKRQRRWFTQTSGFRFAYKRSLSRTNIT